MAEGPIDFGILAGAGAPVKEFKTGDIIFRQGDAATEFYVVMRRRAAPPRWPRPTSGLSRSAKSSSYSWSARRRTSRSTSCAPWRGVCALKTTRSERTR